MEALQPVKQHGSVDLIQHCGADLDNEVGPNSHDVLIEGGVVKLAQGETVANGGFASTGVGKNVGGIQELLVTQAADRTSLSVGTDHALPEAGLMESNQLDPCRISAPDILGQARIRLSLKRVWFVDGDREGQRRRVVIDDEHWHAAAYWPGTNP